MSTAALEERTPMIGRHRGAAPGPRVRGDGRRRRGDIALSAQAVPVRPRLRRSHPAAPGGRPQGVPAPELQGSAPWTAATPARITARPRVRVETRPGSAVCLGVRGGVLDRSAGAVPARPVATRVTATESAGLRLTERGIALVVGVFVVLMGLACIAVATTFWQVTGPGSIYGG